MKLFRIFVILLILCSIPNAFGQRLETKSGFWQLSYYQNEERIPKERFLEILRTDIEAYSFWKTAKTFETLTYPTAILATGFTVWNISNASDDKFDALPAIGGIITSIAGFVFINKIAKNRGKAIQTYNQNIKNDSVVRIEPSSKGFGILIVFN